MARKEQTYTYTDTAGRLIEIKILNSISVDDVVELMAKTALAQILGHNPYAEQENNNIIDRSMKQALVSRR